MHEENKNSGDVSCFYKQKDLHISGVLLWSLNRHFIVGFFIAWGNSQALFLLPKIIESEEIGMIIKMGLQPGNRF